MVVNIITLNGQWALDRLVVRFSEFRLNIDKDEKKPGRWRDVRAKFQYGNALVDLIAIAESFSVSRLTSIRPVSHNVLTSWKSRQDAWKNNLGVDLPSFTQWDSLLGFVEVRNAFQHGLGSLTDFQLGKRKFEVLRSIDAAGVRRNGPELIIARDDVTRAMQTCRAFISWLDVTAPTS